MRLSLIAIGTILTLGPSACTQPDPVARWAGEVQDSAGIRVVSNPSEGLWQPGEGWTVEPGLTLGADSMGVAYQFGRVTDLAVTDDGSIVVLDATAGEVRVFDSSGVHQRTFGRRGEGPGEFSGSPAAVFFAGDGRLVIPDMGNSRINSFDVGGEFIGSVPASYSSGFPVRWAGTYGGAVLVQRRAMGFNEDPDLAAGDPLVRMGLEGDEEMLLILPPAKTVRMEGSAPRFTYFETEPSWHVGRDGLVRTGMTQDYRIELRGPTGELRSIVTRAHESLEATEDRRARFIALMRDALTRRGTGPEGVQNFIEGLEFGATLPAFNQLMAGPFGSTVVQQVQDVLEMEMIDMAEEQSRRLGGTGWDVFDAEGRFLGEVRFPPRFTPLEWGDSIVYGRWLDDLDRHHVRTFRILGAGTGP